MTRRKPDRSRKADRQRPPASRRPSAPRPAARSAAAGPAAEVDALRPWLAGAAVALFVARPLFPSESVAAEGDGLTVVMLWTVLAVFWLLGAIGHQAFPVRVGWVDLPVALLVGWHTVAGVWTIWHGTPRPAVNMSWQWIAFGLSYFLMRQFVRTVREARTVIAVMVALGVSLAGYGLYQYRYELPATRALYDRDPDAALREAGLWYEEGSPERQLFRERLRSTEPLATFALANSLAGYLAPWLAAAAAIGVCGLKGEGRAEKPDMRKRIWIWAGSGLCALPLSVCLLLTKSRSAYVAAVLGVLSVAWLCRPGKRRLSWKVLLVVFLLASVLLAGGLALGGLDRQVLTEAGKSLGYRLEYWRATLHLIADRPLLGSGPGNFQFAYTAYKLPQSSEEIADPHNFLLEVWATAGTPAALALVAVLACWGWSIFRHPGDGRDDGTKAGDGLGPFFPPSDAANFILGGGLVGFLMAIPLGGMSAAQQSPTAVFVGIPLAIASVGLLWPWVQRGRLPLSLPAVVVAVLLVNLLAAGGIGFPGVAGTLWLMLALGLNLSAGDRQKTLTRGASVAGLAFSMAVAVTCYTTAYGPVLTARSSMLAAQADPANADEHLLNAAEADQLWAKPWRELAGWIFHQWYDLSTDRAFETFERAASTALDLNPNAAAAWFQVGEWYRQAQERNGRNDFIQKAATMYQQAVELYPTRSLYRARLALALKASGNQPGFRKHAAEALRLDQINTHDDKELPNELRESLLRIGSDGE